MEPQKLIPIVLATFFTHTAQAKQITIEDKSGVEVSLNTLQLNHHMLDQASTKETFVISTKSLSQFEKTSIKQAQANGNLTVSIRMARGISSYQGNTEVCEQGSFNFFHGKEVEVLRQLYSLTIPTTMTKVEGMSIIDSPQVDTHDYNFNQGYTWENCVSHHGGKNFLDGFISFTVPEHVNLDTFHVKIQASCKISGADSGSNHHASCFSDISEMVFEY